MFYLIPDRVKFYSNRSSPIDTYLISKPGVTFSEILFTSTLTKWNKLDRDIRNGDSLYVFKLSLLKSIRPVVNSVLEINNPYGLKLLTRLRFGLSHLHYHKFRHNF